MTNNLSWKDSVAARLLVKVFQYYIFITLIVTLAHMMMDFSFTKDLVEEDLKVFHTSFEPGLSVALWNQEDDALHSSLLAVYKVPQIEGAKILDDSGMLVTAIGNVINQQQEIVYYSPETLTFDQSGENEIQRLFYYSDDIYHIEDGVKYHIGQLILYSSDRIVFSQVQYGYLFIVINSIIKTVALWIIVLWQSKPLIYEPLKRISTRLKSEQPDSLKDLVFKLEKNENSEMKLLKDSLNKIFGILSKSFAERDAALAEANHRNEELTQFSYRTSHDLKAPLITVRRLSDIIVEDIEDGEYEDVKRNALSISSQVHRLESLITDILDLAKADLANTETELINLNDLLTETSSKLTKAYEATDIVIDLKVPPTLMIRTEKTRLTQILENLLSNAIKYRDQNKNSPFVQVSILDTPDNVMITVEDNGIGIPDEYKSKVFEIFQRFHPSIAIGSGLGLYIVKKHIDKMDAEIFFSSSNNGSSFNIIIKKENGK